jgi:SPP1 gp7 family putative phage head morphogenesis protein
MNASDQLNDLMTIRQLLLGRLIAGENIKLNNHLNDVAARLEAQLRSGKEFTSYQGRRLQQAIGDLAGLVQLQRPDLTDLASMEAKFAQGAVGKVGIDIALPPKKVLQSVADTALVQGATFGDWFSKLEGSMRFDIDRAVKVGVSLGETNAQIAKRILGAGGDKGGEVMPRGRRDAMSITRTAVQTIANEARLATYLENADIIKAVQWISTLDSRTTLICMARSGKTWSIPDFKPIGHKIPWGGGPPAHWACRSTTIPVTKSFEELGGAGPDLSPTTRSSMDGQVAADLTFDNFLKGKPPGFADEMLGVGRADLWRAGTITLSDLLDARGVPLTLAQLKAQYGAASSVAANVVAATAKTVDAIDALVQEMQAYRYSDAYENALTEYVDARDKLDAVTKNGPSTTRDEAIARAAMRDRYWQANDVFHRVKKTETASMLKVIELPADRRGSPASIVVGKVGPTMRQKTEEAARIVASLVDRDVLPNISVQYNKGNRAYYTDADRTIHVNKDTSLSTYVHEMMHDLEYAHPDISTKTKAFLVERGGGIAPRKLSEITGNSAYGSYEVAYEDAWIKRGGSAYMGKLYPSNATELVTMGMERIIADPRDFAVQDPDYFKLMLEIIRNIK